MVVENMYTFTLIYRPRARQGGGIGTHKKMTGPLVYLLACINVNNTVCAGPAQEPEKSTTVRLG